MLRKERKSMRQADEKDGGKAEHFTGMITR